MTEPPSSPVARRRRATNQYADLPAHTPSAGSYDSASGSFWYREVLRVVRLAAPKAHILRTCRSQGSTRYLFQNVELGQIERVKRTLDDCLKDMITHGTVRSHPSGETGSNFREEQEFFYVDVLPNADLILNSRRQTSRLFFSPTAFLFILCLIGMAWSANAFNEHWQTHDDVFGEQIQVFKDSTEKLWGTMEG